MNEGERRRLYRQFVWNQKYQGQDQIEYLQDEDKQDVG